MAGKLARIMYVENEPDIQTVARLALETPMSLSSRVQAICERRHG
jgi:hypothetical protein